MSMIKAAAFVLPVAFSVVALSATAFAQQPSTPQSPGLSPLAVGWVKYVDPGQPQN